MKKAVIYARYSSERQTEQSIEGQIRACQEYAQRNNIAILESYIDRAMTGRNDNRTNFQKMLKDSNKKLWDFVLVYKLDRFSRNKYEMAMHKKTLRDNGVKLVSIMENIPDTPEGIILESLLEGMAEYYSAELAQKVNRGIKESWLKGYATGGGSVFGYDVVDKRYVINERESKILLEMFIKYAQGYKASEIAEYLNTCGHRRKDLKPFDRDYIYFLIHKKYYTGKVVRQGEQYDNIYPRIISDELWQKVDEVNKQNRISPSRKKQMFNYILSTKIVCGCCKSAIIGDSGTSRNKDVYRYYSCVGRRSKRCKCESKSINKELLEDLVIQTTATLLATDENIEMITENIMKIVKQRKEENIALKILEEKRNASIKASKNIVNAIEQGIITEMTKTRLADLEKEIAEIELEIGKEKQNTKVAIEREDVYKFLKSKVFSNVDDINIRKLIVNTFIREIILYPDKIIITYNFVDPIENSPINTETIEEREKQIKSALSSNSCSLDLNVLQPKLLQWVIFLFNIIIVSQHGKIGFIWH